MTDTTTPETQAATTGIAAMTSNELIGIRLMRNAPPLGAGAQGIEAAMDVLIAEAKTAVLVLERATGRACWPHGEAVAG